MTPMSNITHNISSTPDQRQHQSQIWSLWSWNQQDLLEIWSNAHSFVVKPFWDPFQVRKPIIQQEILLPIKLIALAGANVILSRLPEMEGEQRLDVMTD